MRTLIVFNHPYEGSYCSAILDAVTRGLQKSGREVDLIHLDKDEFNPRMTAEDLKAFVDHQPVDSQIIDYNNRIKEADHLIFILPIWWDIMPAATKGFMDRVLFPGVAYEHHPRGFGLVPLLKALKRITIITTMNKPRIVYALFSGNLIQKVMVKSAFRAMGYKNVDWISLTSVKSVSHNKRVKWLAAMEKKFSK